MQLPDAVPVMTLPNVILFPQTMLPLYIFEPRYRQMLEDTLNGDRMFSVAMQRHDRIRESPSLVAGLGLIRASVKNKDGTSNLILQGLTRIKLQKIRQYKPYRIYGIQPVQPDKPDTVKMATLVTKVKKLVGELLENGFSLPTVLLKKVVGVDMPEDLCVPKDQILKHLGSLEDPDHISDLISSTLLSDSEDRQSILETSDLELRLKRLIQLLTDEIHRNEGNGG